MIEALIVLIGLYAIWPLLSSTKKEDADLLKRDVYRWERKRGYWDE